VKRGGSLSFLVGTISNVLVMEIGWTDVGSRKYNSCQILINGMTKIYLTEKPFVIWNYT
jgi:hypothetical protein